MTHIQQHTQISERYTAKSPEQLEDTPARPPCASCCAPSPAHLPSAAEPGGQAVGEMGVRGQRTVQLLAHGHLAGLQHKLALQLLGQLLRQERALKLPGAGTVL